MIELKNPLLARLILTLLCVSLAILDGCGAHKAPLSRGEGIPWPPPPGISHQTAGGDQVTIEGTQADDFGGGAKIQGSSLKLIYVPDQVTYGIWSVSGFLPSITMAQVSLNLSWVPDPPNALTKLFIGLANYTKGYWEWYEVSAAEEAAGAWVHDFATDDDYINNGTVSVAAVITGIASSVIEHVQFIRTYADYVLVPQNLHVTDTNIGSISLDWDDVAEISGYNLYRSNYPDFRDMKLVEGSPFAESQCIDLTGIKGSMMYYEVCAVRGTAQSMRSNMVDIFCPEADLIVPDSIQIGTITPTSVDITWEWSEGLNPESWMVYWKKYPDFNLISDGEPFSDSTLGWERHYTFEGLEPGSVYYFRIAARDSDLNLGRMTDDAPLSTEAL